MRLEFICIPFPSFLFFYHRFPKLTTYNLKLQTSREFFTLFMAQNSLYGGQT